MSENESPLDPRLEKTAREVLRLYGRNFAAAFSQLRGVAAFRERTEIYNLLIESERMVNYWIRIGTVSFQGNVALLSHNLYQPNNPASPVGTPDALKTSQED